VPVLESPFLFCLAPERLVNAVGVERRIDVDEVNGFAGKVRQLFQVVAAVDYLRVQRGKRSRGTVEQVAGVDRGQKVSQNRGVKGATLFLNLRFATNALHL
jgi:hypothetical protein